MSSYDTMHAVLFVFKGTANVFAIMKSLLNVHINTVCVSLDPAHMDSLLSIKSVRKCSVWNELMVRPVCLLQHGNLECTQTLHVINFDSHPPDRRCLCCSHTPHTAYSSGATLQTIHVTRFLSLSYGFLVAHTRKDATCTCTRCTESSCTLPLL